MLWRSITNKCLINYKIPSHSKIKEPPVKLPSKFCSIFILVSVFALGPPSQVHKTGLNQSCISPKNFQSETKYIKHLKFEISWTPNAA